MSRHTLEDGTVVGWDHPMLTFFAQRLDESEEVAIESLGDRPREFYDLDPFVKACAAIGLKLPLDLQAALYMDRDLGR